MGRGGGATHTESCDSAPSPTGRSQPLSAAWVGSPELQRLVSFEGLRSVKQLLKPQWTHSVFAVETSQPQRPASRHGQGLTSLGCQGLGGLWE